MRLTISTKFLGATNTRPARVKATAADYPDRARASGSQILKTPPSSPSPWAFFCLNLNRPILNPWSAHHQPPAGWLDGHGPWLVNGHGYPLVMVMPMVIGQGMA